MVNNRPQGVGWPVMGWHMGQSDARPAHFLGVHAHQWLPLAGWFLQQYRVSQAGLSLSVLAVTYALIWALLTLWALP